MGDLNELAAQLRAGADASVLAGLHGADLHRTNLFKTNLEGANLRKADLREADLRGANLRGANLSEANLIGSRLELAPRRTDLRRANLRGASLLHANLSGANLREADLQGADLNGTLLVRASLARANLSKANLTIAKLSTADLRGIDLCDADLRQADLHRAKLHKADLCNANLQGSNLHRADLREADLRGANLRGATMTDLELPAGIANAHDVSLATIDWRTVARSLRWDGLQSFLVRTGMPDVAALYLIDSLRTIDAMDLFSMLQSVFLSYGRPDEAFADQLRQALTTNGVKTWYYPRDAVPGSRHGRHLQAQINDYDRMILCCSVASLQREGVLGQIEAVLDREQDEGGSEVMIPVLLESIFKTGKTPPPWWPANKEHVYVALRQRVGADFRGAMEDENKWNEQVARVLGALRKKPNK